MSMQGKSGIQQSVASKQESKRFNVLFIISDQHKRSAMGVSGNEYVKTPHLDALAANGITFTAAYCASPLCAPARAALMTSTMPYRNTALFHEPRVNGKPLASGYRRLPGYRPELITMGDYFRKHGYRTGAIGKMHVHGETREHDMGFDERALRIYTYDYEDYETACAPDDPARGHLMRLQYTGQESPASSAYLWPGMFNNRDPERCPAAIEDMPEGLLTEDKMFDVMTTAASIDFIKRHREVPFFLHVGLEKPHPPWTEVKRFMNLYDPDELPDHHLPHAWDEERHDFYLGWQYQGGKANSRDVKIAQAAYYANVTSMDDKVGQLVAALKDAGIYDRTIIVYTSDHGELCYEHGTVQKHNMYEASANVPLIVSSPSQLPAGSQTSCLASHIDLLPTLGDLCGLPMESTFQGKSLVPVLLAPAGDDVNSAVFSELHENFYLDHPDNKPNGTMARVPSRMVRTREWKYIYTHKLIDQLYPVGSGEVFAEDNQSGKFPEIVKTLKRWALAGWDTDGFIGTHDDDDPNIEDMLGDVHLTVKASVDEGGVRLAWESAAMIPCWIPADNTLADIEVDSNSHYGRAPAKMPAKAGTTSTFLPDKAAFVVPPLGGSAHNENCCEVDRFSIYRNDCDNIMTAECVHTTADGSIRTFRDQVRPEQDRSFHYWIIAETELLTLGASNVATV